MEIVPHHVRACEAVPGTVRVRTRVPHRVRARSLRINEVTTPALHRVCTRVSNVAGSAAFLAHPYSLNGPTVASLRTRISP